MSPGRTPPPPTAGDPRRTSGIETAEAGSRGEILVVDDDVGFANGLAALLQSHGFRTRVAYDGDEALEQLAVHPFDVVISDIVMPGMIGCTLVQEAHALPGHDGLPFVFMSVLNEAKVKTFFDGTIRYLQKPFDVGQLLAMLGDALGSGNGPAAPPRGATPAAQ